MGRSSTYTEEIAKDICERIADGASLRSVCEATDLKIGTVLGWVEDHAEFSEQYARAREARADSKFDELDDVSEDAVGAENAVQVAGLRLKADNIKWQLARMAPKKYGDRLTSEITGADGRDLIPPTDPQEVARRVAFLLAKGAA